MKLLVVEDSERLRRALLEGLRRCGFTVDVAGDGQEGLAFAQTNDYDVILLDLMLPGLDGLSLLRKLRDGGRRAQVLILSAKDQVEDRVKGLELGADDYLTKPFAFEELVARIKVLVRRRHAIKSPEIKLGQLAIDMGGRRVRANGEAVSLTPAEYNLLEYLALRQGHVISKAQLRDQLYDSDSLAESNVIEVLISNIRKKVRNAGADDIITTKRGFGYCID
ncbi:MAG: response regulator transcription factor [Arenicellales bacterium]